MKLLACNDGSEAGGHATLCAATLAAALRAELTVLAIAEDAGRTSEALAVLAASAPHEPAIAPKLVARTGRVLDEIVRQTRDVRYDMVVIGATEKRARVPRISPKAYEIVHAVQPPVLVAQAPRETRRILVCTGGREFIDAAVSLAGTLAAALEARVTLFHVPQEPPPFYAGLVRAEPDAAEVLRSDSQLGRNLRRESAALEALGVGVDVRLGRGLVVPAILDEIARGDHDLVVAGTRREHSVQRFVLSDVTRAILEQARRPVLVVRPAERAQAPRWKRFFRPRAGD